MSSMWSSVLISFKNEDNGGAPPEGGRKRSQPTMFQPCPTDIGTRNENGGRGGATNTMWKRWQKKRDTGRPTRAWIRIEGSRALKPTNESQLRDNDRQD